MTARPILLAAEMRAAEERAIMAGASVETLMERAGAAVAQCARLYAGGADALILCGPGNNGGDGYVAARVLAAAGVRVRVAALADPATQAAAAARQQWSGSVERLDDAEPTPLLIDALFGTGSKRGLDTVANEALIRLAGAAAISVAVDLPSGVASDDGALLSRVPKFDLTVALGALKPAHLLQPAAAAMGRIVLADIGVETGSTLVEPGPPRLALPGPGDHKYTRGLVTILAGAMPGAARLAALGAARSGAGYVQVFSEKGLDCLPAAIVVRNARQAVLNQISDKRIGALIVGPGLGRGQEAKRLLALALAAGRPLILDADALWHLGEERLEGPAILTPHEGEFSRLFGALSGSKVESARAAAWRCGGVVLLKGADTVIADPDGRAAIAPPGSSDLATAGSGDVLAGVCGTMLAQLGDPFTAGCAAAWLHGAASRALAGPFIADDLAAALPYQMARCR